MASLATQYAFLADANAILVAYRFIVEIVIIFCWRAMQTSGSRQPSLNLSDYPDPYQLAYLRRGISEVCHLAVLNLWMRSYISQSDRVLTRAESPPSLAILSPLEKQIFECCAAGLDLNDPDAERQLEKAIEIECREFRVSLDAENLLVSLSVQKATRNIIVLSRTTILSTGCLALMTTYLVDIYYLYIIPIFALIGMLWVHQICYPPDSRMSIRGQRYLHSLRKKFSHFQSHLQKDEPVDEYILLLLVALFGTGVLKKTKFYHCETLFPEFIPPHIPVFEPGGM